MIVEKRSSSYCLIRSTCRSWSLVALFYCSCLRHTRNSTFANAYSGVSHGTALRPAVRCFGRFDDSSSFQHDHGDAAVFSDASNHGGGAFYLWAFEWASLSKGQNAALSLHAACHVVRTGSLWFDLYGFTPG